VLTLHVAPASVVEIIRGPVEFDARPRARHFSAVGHVRGVRAVQRSPTARWNDAPPLVVMYSSSCDRPEEPMSAGRKQTLAETHVSCAWGTSGTRYWGDAGLLKALVSQVSPPLLL
jgi:hypothetical protein